MFRNGKPLFHCASMSLCEFRMFKYKNIKKLKETQNKITKKCLVLGFFWWAGVECERLSGSFLSFSTISNLSATSIASPLSFQ